MAFPVAYLVFYGTVCEEMAVIYFPPFHFVKGTKILCERKNGVNTLQLYFDSSEVFIKLGCLDML